MNLGGEFLAFLEAGEAVELGSPLEIAAQDGELLWGEAIQLGQFWEGFSIGGGGGGNLQNLPLRGGGFLNHHRSRQPIPDPFFPPTENN